MYTLGIDVGSSSVKVSLFDVEKGSSIASAFHPEQEMPMLAKQSGWAEQDPDWWWQAFLAAFRKCTESSGVSPKAIKAIGIAYQMHGLVVVDDQLSVLRPSIIWCDSRAVGIGEKAQVGLGADYCQKNLLNSPGNFTASKLRWVKENEPELFGKVRYAMLPGDFIALKLSGEVTTTASGLSEGVFWDFQKQAVSKELLAHYGFSEEVIPQIKPTFGEQCVLNDKAASLTGIPAKTPVTYRAGDQPNNAFSLNVLHQGEVAATAGTSGVIYAVTDQHAGDAKSRVNTFLHVNNTAEAHRNGILLCINGTGILNSWLRKLVGGGGLSYNEMNDQASAVAPGADGLRFYPFGNGAERVLENQYPKATLGGLDLNRHQAGHLFRAAQEGIVFALRYGFDVLAELGAAGETIRAGKANLFLSPLFRETFVNTVKATLQLYNTDGAEGAARGAAYGAGLYSSLKAAFAGLKILEEVKPDPAKVALYEDLYQDWKKGLLKQLNK